MPILLTVAAIFRRLLLLQLSKTRVEVDDLVLEHQLRSSFEVGARIHEPDIDTMCRTYPSVRVGSTRLAGCTVSVAAEPVAAEGVVELTGIEPVTSGLQSRRSPS